MERDEIYKAIINTKKQSKDEARKNMYRILKRQGKKLGLEVLMITDDEIKDKDYTNVHQFFQKIEKMWRVYNNKVMIVVDGYDGVTNELYEIKEVVDYFKELYYLKPHYLFYLNEDVESLQLALLLMSSNTTTFKPLNDGKTLIEKIEENIDDLTDFELKHIMKTNKSYITIDKDYFENMVYGIISYFGEKNEINVGFNLLSKIEKISNLK